MSAARVDVAILLVGIAAISTAAVLIREADAPTLVIATYRLGLASLPLLLIAAVGRRPLRPTTWRRAGLTLLAGACLALHLGFWIASLKETSIVTSVVIVASQPLFVAVVSGPLLGERPSSAVWLGIAVAAAGALVMVGEDIGEGRDTVIGDLLALLGAIFAAAYILAGRGLRSTGSDWLSYVTVVYATAGLLLLAAVVVSGEPVTGYDARTYLFLALIAGVPQLIGHSSINRALGYLPAASVAIAILGEPVGATVLAAVFLSETPTALEAVGSVLVLCGVYLGLRPTLAASRRSASATG
jgi:drug/metabolite transporter (DMT)-like permease